MDHTGHIHEALNRVTYAIMRSYSYIHAYTIRTEALQPSSTCICTCLASLTTALIIVCRMHQVAPVNQYTMYDVHAALVSHSMHAMQVCYCAAQSNLYTNGQTYIRVSTRKIQPLQNKLLSNFTCTQTYNNHPDQISQSNSLSILHYTVNICSKITSQSYSRMKILCKLTILKFP